MSKKIFVFACSLIFILQCFAEEVNIHSLRVSGFEELKDNGTPNFWQIYFSGSLTSCPNAKYGKRAGLLKLKYNSSKALMSSREWTKIEQGNIYRLRIWAKGTGKIQFAPSIWSESTHLWRRKLGSPMALTPEWKQYEIKLNIGRQDPRICRIRFAVFLTGKNAEATFDNAEIIYNSADNPNSRIPIINHQKALCLKIEKENVNVKLFVNGKMIVAKGNEYNFLVKEGISVIGIEADTKSKGVFKADIIGHPETNGRWKVLKQKKIGWMKPAFNDAKWEVVKSVQGDRININSGKHYFRQIILWNKTHYGTQMCIQPRIKTWEFSQNGFDIFHLDLASPLAFPLKNLVFHFEMPENFKVLRMTNFVRRYIYNYPAEKVLKTTVKLSNNKYSKYDISYGQYRFFPEKTAISKIPVKLKGYFKDAECKFYYHRTANGNFTELKQNLPVKMLPEVNGKMTKNILISLWMDSGNSAKSKEFLEADIKSLVNAGVNYFNLNPRSWAPKKEWRNYIKYHYDMVIKNGASFFMRGGDFPCNYGRNFKGHAPLAAEWLQKNKAAQAKYFMNKVKWGSAYSAHAYCPEYILSPAGKEFWDIVKKEYQRWTLMFPEVSIKWTDWEYHVIQNRIKMNYCFCDLCKKAFKKYVKIRKNMPLSDETILKRYRRQWTDFKNWQDGRIQGRIRDVSHQLGWRYMVYSWGWNKGFFKECKNKVDMFFVGCPGDAVADSYSQKQMDDMSDFFRKKTGVKHSIGQRFAFRYLYSGGGSLSMLGRGHISVFSYDGFTDPKSWKSQILRVVAAFSGGIDLHAGHYLSGGIRYYVGEATRLLSKYEDIFYNGKRQDKLTKSQNIAYPNLLTIVHDNERLVLVFNETDKPLSVVLKHLDLSGKAKFYSSGCKIKQISATETGLTVPAKDVVLVHIKCYGKLK